MCREQNPQLKHRERALAFTSPVRSPLLRLYFSWWLPVTVPVSPLGLQPPGTFPARPSAFVHLGKSWFPSLWERWFCWRRAFDCRFFPLGRLYTSAHCLLAPEFLKWAGNAPEASCARGRPLPLCLKGLVVTCPRVGLWVHLTQSSESFFDIYIHVFPRTWAFRAVFLVSRCRDPRDADAGPPVVGHPRSPGLCSLCFRLDTPSSYL